MPVPPRRARAESFRVLGHAIRVRVQEPVRGGPALVREHLAARRIHTAVRAGRTEPLEPRDGEVPAR
ncbi:hypothetical protein ABZ707_21910 [Streptomyces sp. NPDC006923]|uniref:hypothetical protein n=1 Tax=Streptomyces sp. NPDC006923 TaxID=3155355 RepID=UPI0033F11D93